MSDDLKKKEVPDPSDPKETIEFIQALICMWDTRVKVWSNRKFDVGDIGHIVAAAPTLVRGFTGINKIDDERRIIDDEGRAKIRHEITKFRNQDPDRPEIDKLVQAYLNLIDHLFEVGLMTIDTLNPEEDVAEDEDY